MQMNVKKFLKRIKSKILYRYHKWRYPALYETSPGEKQWHENAKKKILRPTIDSINSFLKGKFSITLAFTDLNKVACKSQYPITFPQSLDDHLTFTITNKDMFQVPGVKMESSYGLDSALQLTNSDARKLFVKEKSVINFSTIWPRKPQLLKGVFTNISTHEYKDLKNLYFRMAIKITDPDITFPTDIIEEKNFLKFDISSWDRQDTMIGLRFMSTKGQYCEIRIGNRYFDFFTIDQAALQIIDSLDPTDIETFKNDTLAIRKSFAFLSGKFYRTQVIYVGSNSKDFESVEAICYESEPKSSNTEMELVKPTLYFAFLDKQSEEYQDAHAEYRRMFPSEMFSSLCRLVQENKSVNATVDLIIEGNQNLNPTQRGAIYSIAIETIANVVFEMHEEKLLPVVDKALAKSIRESLSKTIEEFKDSLGEEQLAILKNKIASINQPTNRNRLLKPFEIMGLTLSEDDVKLLEHRNDFLHGKYLGDDEFEVERVSFEFHHLIGCLILKMLGYKGFVTNLTVAYLMRNEVLAKKHLHNYDLAKVASEEAIQQAIDEGKIDEAREMILNTVNAYKAIVKMSSFVRLI